MATYNHPPPPPQDVELNQNGFPASAPNNLLGKEIKPDGSLGKVPTFDPINTAMPKLDQGSGETVRRSARLSEKAKAVSPLSYQGTYESSKRRRCSSPTAKAKDDKEKESGAEVNGGPEVDGKKGERDIQVPKGQTTNVKEVEMTDVEAINEKPNGKDMEAGIHSEGIREVEMQDVEAVSDKTQDEQKSKGEGSDAIKENEGDEILDGQKSREKGNDASKEKGGCGENAEYKDVSDKEKASGGKVNSNIIQNSRQDGLFKETVQQYSESAEVDSRGREKRVNVGESVSVERGSGSGKQVLNEVATLLEEVEKNESKAKLEVEVEVKVKKMDGDVKENAEINQTGVIGQKNENREVNQTGDHNQPPHSRS